MQISFLIKSVSQVESWDSISFAGCYPSLTILAVEHAIENGLDAINYSIGGGSADPWQDPDSLAFLAARKAGIHVATSAGNSGPDAQTVGSPGEAPWITTVAAYTHDRVFTDNGLNGFSGGETEMPETIDGLSMTGGFTGSVVYAGNFANANDPEGDPAQCLQPYPADTFPADTIVLCDRGAIPRVDKGRNVKAGGASGMILANLQGGATNLADDRHVLPSIHVDADNGDLVRSWLASGEGHMATIKGKQVDSDPSVAKIAADFTSRGPNGAVPNIIKPSIAAPGVNIYAAYADDQSAGFKEFPDASDFAFLSGTSMASPHIAGALTILADIHPTWTPAQVQSALMLTADQATYKEDGVTPSDFFDMGAGLANIELAAKTGLVMDESFTGYMQADPALGGSPEEINLASLANAFCVDTCSWTRTLTATKDATWTATTTAADGLQLEVSPSSFSLTAGQSQEITVSADVTNVDSGWNFANIILTASGLPEVKIPVAVKADGDNLPEQFNLNAQRDTGSLTVTGLKSKQLTDIDAKVYDKLTPLLAPFTMSAAHKKWAGILLTLEQDVEVLNFSTSNATAPDFDLEITDTSYNRLAYSGNEGSEESATMVNVPAGQYFVWVFNYEGSNPDDAEFADDVTMSISYIESNNDSLSTSVTAEVVENSEDFSITFNWESESSVISLIELSSGDGAATSFVPLFINRVTNDVTNTVNLSNDLMPGQSQTITMNVAPNFSSEDKTYQLTADVSAGHEIANVSHSGTVSGNTITWDITRKVGESSEILPVSFELTPRKGGSDYTLTLSNTLNEDSMSTQYAFGVKDVAPVAVIDAPTSIKEAQTLNLNGSGSYDDNLDAITYKWRQLGGPTVSFNATEPSISFKAPVTATSNTLVFELVVTDTQGNFSASTKTVTVLEKDSGGGSFGWLMLMLTPLLWLRRKST